LIELNKPPIKLDYIAAVIPRNNNKTKSRRASARPQNTIYRSLEFQKCVPILAMALEQLDYWSFTNALECSG
jgi:hypothetical protein